MEGFRIYCVTEIDPAVTKLCMALIQSKCIQTCMFVLILYITSTIFQLNRDESSWVEPVQS